MELPTLTTTRLLLRPFRTADARVVQRLAGVPEVSLTTINIPYPYEDGLAEGWIDTHASAWVAREFLSLAMTTQDDDVVGAASLSLTLKHRRGELGYWVGRPHWNHGYATEGVAALIEFGFAELGLKRIQARHMVHNKASGRVMEKLGMQYEGTHRHQMLVRGQFVDLAMYAILDTDA